ncbi:hypothetical protein DXG01_007682 [Tephrocybe rancida]|nr:hypothetical protein DXG01_007682 [Tephrocybe rancida]
MSPSSSMTTNMALSSSPDSLRDPTNPLTNSPVLRRSSDASDLTNRLRHSPILPRSFDPEARERQRTMDVDMAMHLSRARRETDLGSPEISPLPERTPHVEEEEEEEHVHLGQSAIHPDAEEEILGPSPNISRIDLTNMHLNQTHDASLLAHAAPIRNDPNTESLFGLPTYQANVSRSDFDFSPMEEFAAAEKATLGLTPTAKFTLDAVHFPRRVPPPTEEGQSEAGPSTLLEQLSPPVQSPETDGEASIRPSSSTARQRKLSHSNPHPRLHRKGIGGKMALFETPHDAAGGVPSLASRLSIGLGRHPTITSAYDGGAQPTGGILHTGHDRPYRFSFYSNALAATIHARSLSELPADGQTFEQLFIGVHPEGSGGEGLANGPNGHPPPFRDGYFSGANGQTGHNGNRRSAHIDQKLAMGPGPAGGNGSAGDSDDRTWWLDVMSPTDDEMKMLSKVFSIHPLTTEDIQMEETREKIELFRNYYLVCFRSFDQDPYSPTYLEPLNMYIIVFREGILSFHFRPTPHPQNVRRRIKQLKDYIAVTSDWISYALIDDITDAFGPLIQSIEYEVDSIDELVLILKEAEQSDMLRRIGTCRKKVMGLLRLMGNKADVVKGLAKRCNENWRVAPTSDIDHLITMTQNLNHYEKILSRSHSNYLAQISIEMTDANNQINDVLSKLTALGTVLIPMNLITGLWGMNVHVPGQDVEVCLYFFAVASASSVPALASLTRPPSTAFPTATATPTLTAFSTSTALSASNLPQSTFSARASHYEIPDTTALDGPVFRKSLYSDRLSLSENYANVYHISITWIKRASHQVGSYLYSLDHVTICNIVLRAAVRSLTPGFEIRLIDSGAWQRISDDVAAAAFARESILQLPAAATSDNDEFEFNMPTHLPTLKDIDYGIKFVVAHMDAPSLLSLGLRAVVTYFDPEDVMDTSSAMAMIDDCFHVVFRSHRPPFHRVGEVLQSLDTVFPSLELPSFVARLPHRTLLSLGSIEPPTEDQEPTGRRSRVLYSRPVPSSDKDIVDFMEIPTPPTPSEEPVSQSRHAKHWFKGLSGHVIVEDESPDSILRDALYIIVSFLSGGGVILAAGKRKVNGQLTEEQICQDFIKLHVLKSLSYLPWERRVKLLKILVANKPTRFTTLKPGYKIAIKASRPEAQIAAHITRLVCAMTPSRRKELAEVLAIASLPPDSANTTTPVVPADNVAPATPPPPIPPLPPGTLPPTVPGPSSTTNGIETPSPSVTLPPATPPPAMPEPEPATTRTPPTLQLQAVDPHP